MMFSQLLHSRHAHAAHAAHATSTLLSAFLLDARDDVIDSKEHAGKLNSSLKDLGLDSERFPDAELTHVRDVSSKTVDAICKECNRVNSVFGTELGDGTDGFGATIGGQRARNDLQGQTYSTIRILFNTFDRF